MAWKLHFLVCCITLFDMSLAYNLQPPPYWGWEWPFNQYYSQVISTAYKYPISHQPLQLAAFHVQENQEYLKFRSNYDRSNIRSHGTGQDYRMHERSIDSSSRRYLQGVTEKMNTHVPQVDESTKRSDNVSSKVLKNILKPIIRRGQVNNNNNNNKIVFPGPTVSSIKTIRIPEACKASTFCEDVPDYPQDEINKIISELDGTYNFSPDKMDVPDTPDINQRVGPTEETLQLCNSDEEVVYPLAAKGVDDKWYTLINRKEKPLQGFKIEICKPENSSCSNIVYFQHKYQGYCQQKYVYRNAFVVENVGDSVKKLEIQVKMPSCCSCAVRIVN